MVVSYRGNIRTGTPNAYRMLVDPAILDGLTPNNVMRSSGVGNDHSRKLGRQDTVLTNRLRIASPLVVPMPEIFWLLPLRAKQRAKCDDD